MSTVLRSLAVSAAGLTAFAVAAPAQAAPGATVIRSAHIQFLADETHPTDLMVDVDRRDGVTTLDVEWNSQVCQNTETTWTCDYLWRRAFDVTPTTFDFSLRSTTVTARFTYGETRYTCSFDGEQETCTDAVDTGTATTDLSVTWTATEAPTTYSYQDDSGATHTVRSTQAPATGTAFGENFAGRDQISQLSQHRIVSAG